MNVKSQLILMQQHRMFNNRNKLINSTILFHKSQKEFNRSLQMSNFCRDKFLQVNFASYIMYKEHMHANVFRDEGCFKCLMMLT